MSWEVARILNCQGWWLGSPSQDRAHTRRRSLQIEPLEVRHLMDAAGLAALVAPSWFQSVPDVAGPQHAGVATWTAEETVLSTAGGAASPAGQSNLYDWIVQFDTASLAGISSVAQTASLLVGGGIEFEAIRGLGLAGQVLVRSSGASLDAVTSWLASDVHVAGFEQDAIRQVETTPNDPQLGSLWGMTKISAQNAWSTATGSRSVVVGVIDTGVDYNHPDLAANIWTNPGEIAGNGIDDDHNGFVDDVHGYDFVNNDGDPMDDNSHGTHVSGTIAAVGNNAQGVAGVNWSASIMALKFLSGQGSGYLSDAVRAINYATMMRTSYDVNLRVTNNSWGGGGFSSAMQNAIQANSDAGILFVAAAGNSGGNNDAAPQYPANYTPANVISVAASDQNDRLASFSCYGATTVDIAAPGVSIYSTLPGNRYGSYSGTSMATPHVAGVAALAWSVAPNASVAQIRNAILQGADPVAALSGKMVTGGRLNAYNTLRLLDGQPPQGPAIASFTASPSSITAGSVVTLAAHGITDASGAVTTVYVYRDANNNGQYEAGDPTVGSTTAIVGGEASVRLNTGGMAPGTYRYLARAIDNNARWSAAVTTTLTVLPVDDHGDTAATATAVGVPSSTPGAIGVAGDVDWFKFRAVAGKTYTLTTRLGTLRDSVLFLYGRNGTTLLTWNDDCDGTLASRITWRAPASGTYYLAVAAYGDSYTGSYALNVQVRSPIGDFNADGTGDVLRQNQATGAVGAWIVQDGVFSRWAGLGQADPNAWKVVGVGDFDGDGTADVLWQNQDIGVVGAWIINNGALSRWVQFGQADPNVWKVAGVGDLNGDGTADVLWQNQEVGVVGAWIINNGALTRWAGIGQADPNVWKVAGVGDLNGDGTADVLWQNQAIGVVGAWIINNGALSRWAGIGQADPNAWKVVGVGDLDGDATADVLWQNQAIGMVGAWIINNGALTRWAGIGQADPNVWKVAGVADYSGDATSDVLWQNQSSGSMGTWIISNGAYVRWAASSQTVASELTPSAVTGSLSELPSVFPHSATTLSNVAAAWLAIESRGVPGSVPGNSFDTPAIASPLTGSPAWLHDDIFARLAPHEGLQVGRSERLTVLDSQLEYLAGRLADVRLPYLGTTLRGAARSAAGNVSPAAREETAAEDLLACCSVERHAVDEIFDLLGQL